MPLLEIGQSVLRYDVYGEGPALVFAHGVGGNRVSWFNQIPHFQRSHRVVVFDHRAFGGIELRNADGDVPARDSHHARETQRVGRERKAQRGTLVRLHPRAAPIS